MSARQTYTLQSSLRYVGSACKREKIQIIGNLSLHFSGGKKKNYLILLFSPVEPKTLMSLVIKENANNDFKSKASCKLNFYCYLFKIDIVFPPLQQNSPRQS